eukprot:TRINITY_DN40351_c0_g1_i1.p1 TRINITY_DN40351_c0_g1~~TRINITY_DN40351_c0_g1_i1.p1  ORF type:complete len:620 (+),score=120.04 TRINITY_DN40351_c0_g1_i1:37-1860(+)
MLLRFALLATVLCFAAGQDVPSGDEAELSSTTEAASSIEEGAAFTLPLMATIPAIVVLVMLSGLFSGLTLGLMGLDLIGLETVEKGDNIELARCAAKIKPIRERGNLLLCTLLLGNVAVNSALSILTADVASGPVGFAVSTGLIVIFGEILPQACCAKYALQIGARAVYIVKFLLALFFVLTYPMSVALDFMLGKDLGQIYSKSELMEMVKLQLERGATDMETGRMAKQVVEGALKFREVSVRDVMTPVEDTYMLPGDTRLGYETIRDIHKLGFSRIPVYGKDKHDYKGLLYTKDLILVDPEDEMKLQDFIEVFDRKALTFELDDKLASCLTQFRKGSTHLGLVRSMQCHDPVNPVIELKGVITLEDIVEEILQEEIIDEADVYVDVDNHKLVGDGREKRHFNLGLFNSKWSISAEVLEADERKAVAAHLCRTFADDYHLRMQVRAFEWLLAVSEVQNRERFSPLAVEVPDARDQIYKTGDVCDFCTVVLQGRVSIVTGQDRFKTESGTFSVLARDALKDKTYKADFCAFVKTLKGRLVIITRKNFAKARELDKSTQKLQAAISQAESVQAGEAITATTQNESLISYGKRYLDNSSKHLNSCSCWGM